MRHALPSLGLAVSLAFALSVSPSLSPSRAFADPPRASAGVREADQAILRATRAGRQLLSILDDTRRAGRRDQQVCVDGNLTQVNSFNRTLVDRRRRLVDAEAREDHASARHERYVIGVLRRQVDELAAAGRACVFPGGGRGGRTIVIVDVDRTVPRHQDLEPRMDMGDPYGR